MTPAMREAIANISGADKIKLSEAASQVVLARDTINELQSESSRARCHDCLKQYRCGASSTTG